MFLLSLFKNTLHAEGKREVLYKQHMQFILETSI